MCWMISNLSFVPGIENIFFNTTDSLVRFNCNKCGRSYAHYTTLWTHMKYICGKEPKFKCHQCTYRGKLKKNLNEHIKRTHNKE